MKPESLYKLSMLLLVAAKDALLESKCRKLSSVDTGLTFLSNKWSALSGVMSPMLAAPAAAASIAWLSKTFLIGLFSFSRASKKSLSSCSFS